MSSFNLKSTAITNTDATPSRLSDPIKSKGMLQEVLGTERVPTTADIGSQVRLVAVPSAARVSSLDYAGQALGTSSLDIAAWYPTYVPVQSGVVAAQIIGSSIFGQALFNSDGATNWTDGLGSVAQNAIPSREQPLWQKLGLVADPNCDIHLGFTVRTTNSIAGYVGLRARYIR